MPQTTAHQSIVTVPERIKSLPCMEKLTENQQNFVWAMVETGGMDPGKAAAMSGYGGTGNSRSVRLHRLMHDEDIIQAINECATKQMKFAGLLGAMALIEVVKDIGHKDRVKAIGMLLEHADHIPIKTQRIEIVRPEPSTAEIVARIRATSDALGIDPRPLLLQAGVDPTIIDAEFTEIHNDPDYAEDAGIPAVHPHDRAGAGGQSPAEREAASDRPGSGAGQDHGRAGGPLDGPVGGGSPDPRSSGPSGGGGGRDHASGRGRLGDGGSTGPGSGAGPERPGFHPGSLTDDEEEDWSALR